MLVGRPRRQAGLDSQVLSHIDGLATVRFGYSEDYLAVVSFPFGAQDVALPPVVHFSRGELTVLADNEFARCP